MSSAPPETKQVLERLRKALAHDLRSPLGTIGNYATILEYHNQANPEEVRAFAGRIRTNVVRTAAMLASMADVLTLVLREPLSRRAEPMTILRSLLMELGVQCHFPPSNGDGECTTQLDPEILRFCWHALLDIQAHDVAHGGLDPEVICKTENGVVTADLKLRREPPPDVLESIDCSAYVVQHLDQAPNACFALSLAVDLVAARGGSLEILGHDGVAALLRLRLPIEP